MSTDDEYLARVREAAAHVDRATNERAAAIAMRDRAILSARNRGHTWVDMQDAAGLSPRGLQKVFDRTG